jgi:hypothetical protein
LKDLPSKKCRQGSRRLRGLAPGDGYSRITVYGQQLRIAFHQALASDQNQSRFDIVTVDLATHTIVAT